MMQRKTKTALENYRQIVLVQTFTSIQTLLYHLKCDIANYVTINRSAREKIQARRSLRTTEKNQRVLKHFHQNENKISLQLFIDDCALKWVKMFKSASIRQ